MTEQLKTLVQTVITVEDQKNYRFSIHRKEIQDLHIKWARTIQGYKDILYEGIRVIFDFMMEMPVIDESKEAFFCRTWITARFDVSIWDLFDRETSPRREVPMILRLIYCSNDEFNDPVFTGLCPSNNKQFECEKCEQDCWSQEYLNVICMLRNRFNPN
jgi:hypothetical protein